MTSIRIAVIIFLFCGVAAHAQEAMPPAISSAYEATLSALQSAKTPEDVHRMVDAMDTPDWVSIAPTGEKMSRDEAEKQLVGLLSIPVGKRPVPLQKTIYVGEIGPRVVVVYWVYRITDAGAVGSIVRDSWLQTPSGWRRSLHEKLFPDRLLKLP
jgi:hypothetical protein